MFPTLFPFGASYDVGFSYAFFFPTRPRPSAHVRNLVTKLDEILLLLISFLPHITLLSAWYPFQDLVLVHLIQALGSPTDGVFAPAPAVRPGPHALGQGRYLAFAFFLFFPTGTENLTPTQAKKVCAEAESGVPVCAFGGVLRLSESMACTNQKRPSKQTCSLGLRGVNVPIMRSQAGPFLMAEI